MKVELLPRDRWSEFFALNLDSPWGHVFNGRDWLASIEELFGDGGRLEIFGVFDDGHLRAGLPIWNDSEPGDPRYGGRNLNFPATPYSGLTIGKELLDRHPRDVGIHAAGEAVAGFFSRFSSAFILHPPEYVELRPFLAHGWRIKVKFDYRIDLASLNSADDLLSPAMRRMVGEASISGAGLQLSRDPDLFTRLWRSTYGSDGAFFGSDPEKGKRHFHNLIDSGTARFHVAADASGEVTCGWLVLRHGRKMYGYGTLNLRGSDALYTWMRHAVLEEYRKEGFAEFNWCGANVFKRMVFKHDFNPTLIPFFGCAYEKEGNEK